MGIDWQNSTDKSRVTDMKINALKDFDAFTTANKSFF